MKKSPIVWFALTIWGVVFAASFVVPATMEATGDGFTRGLNRLSAFFGYQAGAAALALVAWLLGNRRDRGSPARWLSRVPAAMSSLLVLGVLALIVFTTVTKPTPDAAAPGPATSPDPLPEPTTPTE